MKFRIEYCGAWNYEPRARRAQALIQSVAPNAEVELIRGGGGVFEIERDGALLYSKKATGVFPEESAIKDFARW